MEKQQAKIARQQLRVYRNGRYYNTDQRGADLLRQAVNAGYQQGFDAGRNDRSSRRRSSWTTSNVYRQGSYGYQSYVDRSQYQYYFQQGFQRGYQDGYNSRYQYGSNNGGSVNILGSILSSILNIQTY
jgi:flagellar biosynthesis/type III secretory pathway protein FliH